MGKLTSKGQVTIPKAVRDLLGLRPGSEVCFRLTGNTVMVERADGQKPHGRFAQLRGIAGPGLSTDEIMALTRSADEP